MTPEPSHPSPGPIFSKARVGNITYARPLSPFVAGNQLSEKGLVILHQLLQLTSIFSFNFKVHNSRPYRHHGKRQNHELTPIMESTKDLSAATASFFSPILASISGRGQLPIIVGGSNSYIEALIDDENSEFQSKYDCCFLWVDVSMSLLQSFVSEFDEYFRLEAFLDEESRRRCRLDATDVLRKHGKEADEAWKKLVENPSSMIVNHFLYNFGPQKYSYPTSFRSAPTTAMKMAAAL